MNIGELAKFRGGVSADTISELTSASGVTIDGVLLKDANITASGTGTNAIAGNTAIGSSAYSDTKLRIAGSPGTAAQVFGIYADNAFASTATGTCMVMTTAPSLAAASFNMANLYHFRAFGVSLGAGSSMTNQHGFYVDSSLTAASGTNYGFYSNIAASGTLRYNFYANGTAPNFMGGLLSVGNTATTDVALSTTVAAKLRSGSATYTDNVTAASGTVSHGTIVSFDNPAIAATNASVTYTNASTLYIDGAPTAGSNVTITNPYALYVAAGNTYLGGSVGIGVAPSPIVSGLYISKNITGGTSAYQLFISGQAQSDVTNTARAVYVAVSTNAALSNANIISFVSGQGTYSGSVSSYIGYSVDSTSLSATTNYGFFADNTAAITTGKTSYAFYAASNIATGGGTTYNFYANGTAPNVFKGAITTPRTTLTASATGSGAITVINNYHAVSGAGGAASTITTINGGIDGMMVVLKAVSDTVDISFATGGNILLDGGATFTCDTLNDTITLIYDASLSKWLEIGRCNNS